MRSPTLLARAMVELASLAIAIASCSSAHDPVAPAIPDRALPLAAVPSPTDAPWGIRMVRRCSEWEYAPLLVSERHAFTCAHVAHDRATGQLAGFDLPEGEPIAAAGARSLWHLDRSLEFRDRDLTSTHVPVPWWPGGAAARRPGREEIALSTEDGVVVVDLERREVREVEGSAACADARALAIDASSAIRCVVERRDRDAWIEIGGAERELAPLEDARFDPAGERLIGRRDGALVVASRDRLVFERELGPFEILDVASDGRVLASLADRVILVPTRGGDIETVLAEHVDQGRFAGDEIVLQGASNAVLWMRRGAWAPPSIAIETPTGLIALDAVVDGDSPAWGHGEARYARAPADVAAFERDAEGAWAHVTVARLDRSELARSERDDAEWGRALMARYVAHGTERTGHVYRDAAGRRTFRGHAWIGGCERTHVDVMVRERTDDETALELWAVDTGDREQLDALPDRARCPRGPRRLGRPLRGRSFDRIARSVIGS